MNEPNKFTENEEYVIAYYRSQSDSIASELAWLAVSIGLAVWGLWGGDPTWGVLAFLLLVYRMVSGIWISRRWNPLIKSIILKYDAQLKEISAEQAAATAVTPIAEKQTPSAGPAEHCAIGNPPGSSISSDGTP